MCQKKLERLHQILEELGGVVVAFSGGVDSTFLLQAALQTLGRDKVLAVTAAAPYHPADEIAEVRHLAESLKVRHRVVSLELPDALRNNPKDRCYRCKKEIMKRFLDIAAEGKMPHVVEGSNADDTKQYRPGRRALKELGIRSPLAEAELSKDEIRRLSKEKGLPTWNRPASACLLTRLPYGQAVQKDLLKRVAAAEDFLRARGFSQVRVRHHGNIARIEVLPTEHPLAVQKAKEIVGYLKDLGYVYITLDLEGFRSGSMDVGLT